MGLEGLKQNLIKGKEAVFFKLHSVKYVLSQLQLRS